MVFAFIIHTVSTSQLNILYTQLFGCLNEKDDLSSDEERREKRKEFLHGVALRVVSECDFARSVSNMTLEKMENLAVGPDPLSEADKGIFKVSANPNHPLCPSDVDLVVVWRANLLFGFTLIIHNHENTLLAQETLKNLIRYLDQYVNFVQQSKNIVFKPDQIENVVNHCLPNGQLLFLNHRMVRHFEKELDKNFK